MVIGHTLTAVFLSARLFPLPGAVWLLSLHLRSKFLMTEAYVIAYDWVMYRT